MCKPGLATAVWGIDILYLFPQPCVRTKCLQPCCLARSLAHKLCMNHTSISSKQTVVFCLVIFGKPLISQSCREQNCCRLTCSVKRSEKFTQQSQCKSKAAAQSYGHSSKGKRKSWIWGVWSLLYLVLSVFSLCWFRNLVKCQNSMLMPAGHNFARRSTLNFNLCKM